MKTKMDNNFFISDLADGNGSIKHYNYFVSGIKVRTKRAVYVAMKLRIAQIIRVDKIINKRHIFNYKTRSFEEMQEWQLEQYARGQPKKKNY